MEDLAVDGHARAQRARLTDGRAPFDHRDALYRSMNQLLAYTYLPYLRCILTSKREQIAKKQFILSVEI
jgi:hypothetical protein